MVIQYHNGCSLITHHTSLCSGINCRNRSVKDLVSLFLHCRVTCPNVKAVEKLTSQLRYMKNFSVVDINFVKTAETEALAQCITGLNEDSSSLKIPIYIYSWY